MERNKIQFWKGYLCGAAVFLTGNIVGNFVMDDDSDERVINTQLHHEQVGEILDQKFDTINELRLDGHDSFTFETTEGVQLEVCQGDYKVRDNRAVIIGDLACTRTVEQE